MVRPVRRAGVPGHRDRRDGSATKNRPKRPNRPDLTETPASAVVTGAAGIGYQPYN
ncbi:hypothetical protein GCM10023322_15700 [Rugosimonospora acidiphila]|uniref:Uncharacterized protein n=1 Tax=Rugosimonospora acidiphila TaxID=556531 RepID=A0ABP9RMI0_9ACTN